MEAFTISLLQQVCMDGQTLLQTMFSVAVTKYLKLSTLKNKGAHLVQFWKLKVQDQVAPCD